jgi:sulfur carrier protein ThiS
MEQRTVTARSEAAHGQATVAAFGYQRIAAPGRSVEQTLAELGLRPEPFQSVRVNGKEVRDMAQQTVQADDVVTVVNRVEGGRR